MVTVAKLFLKKNDKKLIKQKFAEKIIIMEEFDLIDDKVAVASMKKRIRELWEDK